MCKKTLKEDKYKKSYGKVKNIYKLLSLLPIYVFTDVN